MAARSDTSTNRIPGISIAFSLLIYVAAWLAAPEYYFGIASDSDAALICYIVAALLLALSVVGFGIQLSDREVSAFLASLVSKRLPQGIWGTPSAQTWRALGDTAATFIVTAVIHLIGIEAFDATGIAAALVKIVVLVLFGLVVIMLSGFIDELVVKPLIVIPARRLASEQIASSTRRHDQGGSGKPSVSGRKIWAVLFLLGEILGFLQGLIWVVQAIAGATYIRGRLAIRFITKQNRTEVFEQRRFSN